ncbi:MAG TPA: hypothetical protein VG326_08805 [Tepidisphaeraceae bacterium]|jgi:hypothetical protein|nr:hypothetical protein [Tepidisphaeraceae bacterium]
MYSIHSAFTAMPAAAASAQTIAPPSLDFWQRPFVRNVLPIITSVSLHAMVLMIGLMMYTAVSMARTPMQIQTTAAEFTMPDANAIPGVTGNNPEKPWLTPTQNEIRETDASGASSFKGTKMELSGGANADESAKVFAGGPGSFGSKGIGGSGDGHNGGPNDGSGAPGFFGAPHPGGGGTYTFVDPRVAREVVFLCDATGSMLNKMATLKDELNKAVTSLKPTQSFDIIFYQGSNVYSFSKSLSPATPENKRKAGDWLQGITAQDVTLPVPALETALKLHPELIYLLTDAADFPDTGAVVDAIDRNNKDRRIKINTILFVEDKTEREKNIDSEGLMKKIAVENGGKFRWVEMDAIQR